MPELKIASSIRICSGFGFHLGFGSGLRSSHPGTVGENAHTQTHKLIPFLELLKNPLDQSLFLVLGLYNFVYQQ